MNYYRHRAAIALILAAFLTASASLYAQNAENHEGADDLTNQAKTFLDNYLKDNQAMSIPAAEASWRAATTGKKEDFDTSAELSLKIRKYHSSPEKYKLVKDLWEQVGDKLDPVDARSLQLAERSFRSNQLPADLLAKMVELSTEIEMTFNTYRAELDGKRYSNNELLEMLADENDSQRREKIWRALKQVGAEVAPQLIELAKLRNQAARQLGYDNYWAMRIDFQEHDPEHLVGVFSELETLTNATFADSKADIDAELAERFNVAADKLMPWHYDNPFFQAPSPSPELDLNRFYEDKQKEDIAEISRVYFTEIGLPVESILAKSDLYEREGKDQHAFCTNIDGEGDVRILCNLTPTFEWMTVQLHELGHAVYSYGIDRKLPYNVRHAAHALTTEGVAMYFGALPQTREWMIKYADADPETALKFEPVIREQRRREQLIFARWTMVMLNFEKAFYENPDRDLNTLWWDLVERYQGLTRPDGDAPASPDWAAKPHFTIAPVYYHNYQLGEMFAAQLRHAIAEELGEKVATTGIPSEDAPTALGEFLLDKVFGPGAIMPWPAFVERSTGEPLSARYFADETSK